MTERSAGTGDSRSGIGEPAARSPAASRGRTGGLFRKYALVIGSLTAVVLLINGGLGTWLSYSEHRASLIQLQQERARAAADRIEQFLRGLEGQIGWAVQLPWSGTSLEQRRFDALRLLGQAPALAELAVIDPEGREQLRVSRLKLDVLKSGVDRAKDPAFTEAMASGRSYGPVYFRRESEPFLTLAVAGRRRDLGVAIAEINLKFIWDLVAGIAAGAHGTAYLVDGRGRLIAHPDLNQVLRRTDLSSLAQIQAALRSGSLAPGATFRNRQGASVVVASAKVASTDWIMLIEVPVSEVFEPVYRAFRLSGWLLLATLILSAIVGLLLARRLVVPIRALEAGAARIASGDLTHRIAIRTGDELEELAAEFNAMTRRLERSYSELEARVQERTRELEDQSRALARASDHKSQFLAVMSHELRTPLNAIIGLTEALIGHSARFGTGGALEPLRRVHRAGVHLLDLINQLLDLAKIEAGKLEVCREPTALAPLVRDVVETAGPLARKNGNTLAVSAGRDLGIADVDALRLRQVLLNIVGNACKFTRDGEIVLEARRLRSEAGGELLEFVVSDTGIGMTPEELAIVFDEFAQATAATVRQYGGTGLGLSIARRLCHLMQGDITADSVPGRGSRFVIRLPDVPATEAAA
jgi:two-component system, NtrC family, sensor kinase